MRWLTYFVIVTAAMLALGCGSFRTFRAQSSEYDRKDADTNYSFKSDPAALEVGNRYGLMALFAEVVYRRDLKGDCKYLLITAAKDTFGMPTEGGAAWERWLPDQDQVEGGAKVYACRNEAGLYYETYVHKAPDGGYDEAVIAYRGSEKDLSDWIANFSSFFGFEPKQYALARQYLPAVMTALNKLPVSKNSSTLKVYAVGHSLGGGLAQQAGYSHSGILEVFAFNSTPVTNWTGLRLDRAVAKTYPIIHRIHHNGEVLDYLRFIAAQFTGARFGRHDVGIAIREGNAVYGHSMQIISRPCK